MMSDALANLFITRHALARWRERVAAYGDAPASEVVAAVRAATLVPPGDPLPTIRLDGKRYFRHATRPTVYFVTDNRDARGEAVITVIDTAYRPPLVTPKRRARAEPPPPESPAPAPPGRAEPDWEFEPEPAFADVGERRQWLAAQQIEAQVYLSWLKGGDPRRPFWASWVTEVCRRLSLIRDEFTRWRRERAAAEELPVRRADGGLNYGPAIRFLLAEVERLSAEVRELRAGRDQRKAA